MLTPNVPIYQEKASSALTGRTLVSFAPLNHFLKFKIEKPTTSPLSGLTLRKKSASTSLEIASLGSPRETSNISPSSSYVILM